MNSLRPRQAAPFRVLGSTPALALATTIAVLMAGGAAARAGDILRGGASAGKRSGPPAATATNQPAALRAAANARDALARASKAVQSVQAMQQSARAAAQRGPHNLGLVAAQPGLRLPNVPNGLRPGGLQVAPGVPVNLTNSAAGEDASLWQGALLPIETTTKDLKTVTVRQPRQQAVLNWQTFNIGKETRLQFDQSAGGSNVSQWIAFNKVVDPTGQPSQILGSLRAQGQVYVINQNGIIFGGSSQVNTHTLVASSLPINTNLLARGILNNPDDQFLFSALPIPALPSGATMSAFTPPDAPPTSDGHHSDVVVQKGALLSSPTTAAKVGGRIALVGANVKNEGTISTPDGQTILAAGLQVGFTPHVSSDPSLRGLDVYVGRVAGEDGVAYAGTVTNAGLLNVPRASATLAGRYVQQLGVINSSTSVSLNGRIDLLANYNTSTAVVLAKPIFTPGATGFITLGHGSTMQILPEYDSGETIAGTKLPISSQINLQGRAIHFERNSQLLAPGANVTVKAGSWLPLNGQNAFTYSTGQIYLDRGASINVAGSPNVTAPITQNILALQLRGSELADSPVQRTGPLRATLLNIDIRQSGVYNGFTWVGTPLGDVSGYVGLIERNAGQLTTAGGSVHMNAGSSVVMQPDSVIDVSGGWTNFKSGLVQTTRVISDGFIVDISQATPDRIYTGLYDGTATFTSPRWGISRTYTSSLALSGAHWEAGYLQGGDGGSVTITAPAMALDGSLLGRTVAGDRQRASPPAGSALSLAFQAQNAADPVYPTYSPTPPHVIFTASTAQSLVGPFNLPLPESRLSRVLLSPDLLKESGFSSLDIENSDGLITVPTDITLTTAPGGSITFAGANIEIFGKVSAPGGQLAFTSYNISPTAFRSLQVTQGAQTPAATPSRGLFTLGSSASLSAAGLLVDDRLDSLTTFNLPLSTKGGTVAIKAYSADLATGSKIDVSGGAAIDARGKVTYGAAGGIQIITGQDPNLLSVVGGRLHLGARLRGFGGKQGGSLSIQATAIQVGGRANPSAVQLDPGFFSQGGFTEFKITALGEIGRPGLEIVPGTLIAPRAETWLFLPHAAEGGADLVAWLNPETALRPPVSVAFTAAGVRDTFTGLVTVRGDLAFGEGARIITDPLARVSLTGDTVNMLGSIMAPGGSIAISGGRDSTKLFLDQTQALATVYLGPRSSLSAAGTSVTIRDAFGRQEGSVLPGGSIAVTGNLVAATGATLDVSGTKGILDLTPAAAVLSTIVNGQPLLPASSGLTSPLFSRASLPTRIDSNAGTITLTGGQILLTDATLVGRAGGSTALGGTLSVTSGRFYAPDAGAQPTPLDVTLEVAQSAGQFPSLAQSGNSAIGRAGLVAGRPVNPGHGFFGVNRFEQGGFDSLALRGTVQFDGAVSVSARGELSVADAGVLFANAAVQLKASHVTLGTPFLAPVAPEQAQSPFLVAGQTFNFLPTHGAGSLTVTAALIDVGNLSLQGVGHANLLAEEGDIRGSGTLDLAGDLLLRAGQIYPVTASTFTLAASDWTAGTTSHAGSVTILGSGQRQLPLSAGGTLNVDGSRIYQGGTLRAPLGTINLGWDGTGAVPKDAITGQSLAIAQAVTLAGGSTTSVSLIDPATGRGTLIPFGLILNGVSWIDPRGVDITAGGVPGKAITVAALNVRDQAGSTIDLRGGGDLYAYRWVKGVGGSRDVLATNGSFAVLPDYEANFAPYAPFNSAPVTDFFSGDSGYVNSTLRAGDRIYLGANSGLSAGTYTLLPARYALLPGTFLVTPKSGIPYSTVSLTDGASLVPGYRFNDLNTERVLSGLPASFEVASAAVIRARSQYTDSSANDFLRLGADKNEVSRPRLPQDGGHLILQATQTMTLLGNVQAQAAQAGRGGLVDIASTSDILIGGAGASAPAGTLALDASRLSSFGAESLLIGGTRQVVGNTATVAVTTNKLTVDNAGARLSAPDLILVAKQDLTLAPGAIVSAAGDFAPADHLIIGSAAVPGSGDGVLLRVSTDPQATISRAGVTDSKVPQLKIGAGSRIIGSGVVVDSTAGTSLDPEALIRASHLSLNSGRLSLQLDESTVLPADAGLVLAGLALADLERTRALSLLSYASIDVYGSGRFTTLGSLSLHAAELRGFQNNGGVANFTASSITLDNRAGRSVVATPGALEGTLAFNSGSIVIGDNQVLVSRFANLELNAAGGLHVVGTGGLHTLGALTIEAPVLTAARAATQSLVADGALVLVQSGSGSGRRSGGLGASLTLQGASVLAGSDVLLPSGLLTLHATTGDVTVEGRLDAGGTAQTFFDLIRYTDAGQITLQADQGSVNLGAQSVVDVASAPAAGSAGTLSISAPQGGLTPGGQLLAEGSARGTSGSFLLDVSSLSAAGALNAVLAAAHFSEAQNIRVRSGDVLIDGAASARMYHLSADEGSISVSGTIDASGATGGSIALEAAGSVTLLAGSKLTAAGEHFSSAGKGGAISLETRGLQGGAVDLQTGSTIDLSIASDTMESPLAGHFAGTLHLRAPQTAGESDLLVKAIGANIIGASSIVAEGYKIYDLTGDGQITSSTTQAVQANGFTFGGNSAAITTRLLAGSSILSVQTGAEIINRTGDLTLGSATSFYDSDWDLSTFRFGPQRAPGVLTMRAAGNLIFFNTLSDGFNSSLYTGTLLTANPLLSANAQSWSYRLVAGADFTAADSRQVLPLGALGADQGSLLLGKNAGSAAAPNAGPNATTALAISDRFQVIRTGSGDIDIVAGRDVRLLNPFATIYTAGTQVDDPTLGGTFDVPYLDASGGESTLGAVQEPFPYPPQYSWAGGNVSITAGGDIAHSTRVLGETVADSERQLPMNWLYRRGFVDPATGSFGTITFTDPSNNEITQNESTTWWVDFSNFFEGVGTLGGGNLTLNAGHDVANVDGVVATNARMPGGTPSAAGLVELGGGDLFVRAGHNIDAGVYYVERGRGTLVAGHEITTNATRSPSLGLLQGGDALTPETFLPTTLFAGQASFNVSARGDLLLGPVANPFLLPEGYSNTYWYKTYFSTYATEDAVNVSSLAGTVTLRTATTLPTAGQGAATPLLQAWLQRELLLSSNPRSASYYQPWLRLDETNVAPFSTVAALMPSNLRVTAFSGAINLVGGLLLSPSPAGTLELASATSINGLQPNGQTFVNNLPTTVWGASTINVSDANPGSIPGVVSPFAYQSVVGAVGGAARVTGFGFLDQVDALFTESGATQGAGAVLQSEQALHATGPLHATDREPLRLYAGAGNISGLTLFSPKEAQVFAGRDITDIALYLQNTGSDNVSVVSSGRDIVAYNANSPLRVAARAAANALNFDSGTLAGDIQIAGPGTLEVLAGRHLDLGVGPNGSDGTALGLTSIGNARNPFLPFAGADIIAAAGLGGPASLAGSSLDVDGFLHKVESVLALYLPELGRPLLTTSDLDRLPKEERAALALDLFYLILRDAGRNFPTAHNYDTATQAIAALFPHPRAAGDISLTSREIKSQNGGNISLLAPSGKLAVGFDAAGNQALDQGILTEAGGNIQIFTQGDVEVGTSRIFTLRGGNEIIYSAAGNIAAGAASKTVQSAPPTRVLIDPQSGDVKTDLAGLATGGGIGVLATVGNVPPGNVDLIAPAGTVDAGDAGIRVSGNLNIAAVQVLNADNISVTGSSVGAPVAPALAAPSFAGLGSVANAAAATAAADQSTRPSARPAATPEEAPSIITVEVYAPDASSSPPEEEQEKRRRRQKLEADEQR